MRTPPSFFLLTLAAPLALTALLLGTPGCSESSPTSQPALTASDNPPIADVPVPNDFHLVKDDSTSKVYFTTGIREVDHVYHGKAPQLSVVRFYRETMPANGWTYTLQRESPDAITEFFTKNNEQCIIQISTALLHTTIRVQVYPTAAGAAPKTER